MAPSSTRAALFVALALGGCATAPPSRTAPVSLVVYGGSGSGETLPRLARQPYLRLRARDPGQRPRGLFQAVQPARGQRADNVLEPASRPELAHQLARLHEQGGDLLRESDGLRTVLGEEGAWLGVTGQSPVLKATLTWLTPDGRRPLHCTGQSPAALADCLGPQLYHAIAGRPLAGAAPSAPAPFYRRWWLWTTVGSVLAAGAATGIYFTARPGDGVKVLIETK